MRFARGVVSAPPSFPWLSIFLTPDAGKTPNTNVLAIKQVRAFCSLLFSAYVFAFVEQKLHPLHAWAGDGVMMYLLCHCRSPPPLRPQNREPLTFLFFIAVCS
jgi:hypothetical protein